jgi:hypothetical protein
MELAVIVILAYVAGATSTGLAVALWPRRRQRQPHYLIALPGRPAGPGQQVPPYWDVPRRFPAEFPGPAAAPPYW